MFYSPLRYPGGKGKIAEFIKLIFDKNELKNGCYVEPYAGGASIALSLLFSGYASKIIINDYDRSIYAFWYSVLNYSEELCKLIKDVEVNIEEWYVQKEVQKHKNSSGLLELGFSTFFLNRTNRSGIIKAGVIGGKKQDGEYKMDARFNKIELISRIEKIAKLRKKIKLYNLDAIDLITKISKSLPHKTLIYFDPPYYVKGKDLYVNYYKHEDHLLVSQMVNGIENHKWLVSYDSTPEIKLLYRKNKKFEYSLNYSAVNSKIGKEVMIYNKNLFVPKLINPTFVK
jgi:DNA adenine methylase